MSLFRGKKILLGISGGIAAYKTPELVRAFIKQGAEVRIVMTPASKDFVTPLTLATVSRNPVHSSLIAEDHDNPTWNNHVELALWADYFLIAPATSNTLSSMAHARCNNIVLATYLSSQCPVFVAPAMDLDMFSHPANQKNLSTLSKNNVIVLPTEEGFLASGLEGKGRMPEPTDILAYMENHISKTLPLFGKKVVLTAGPTYEPIDPVRFIGNNSSGKMGFELAKRAVELGANVILISGPSAINIKNTSVKLLSVVTADQMFENAKLHFEDADIFIASAAVADFKPETNARQKIKKGTGFNLINLVPTPDILAHLGSTKKNQFLVGFALETENELENASEKLKKKNLDAIVLNSLNDAHAGFGGDQNKITYIQPNKAPLSFELKSKTEVAIDIFDQILEAHEKLF
ncbi:MAG: bifunctional phosphopantothenoylcysteine decarboxylase/phosphopantothenate--cysteine ligase CoaBC [Flavobacteriales bacterium]|nr:bifunctional phosphopantothenoylcysteine decarboxylase/phosphopantothenate--cysteine ligase CoaBC [Candidatus Arcticimaribacter sp.]